MVDIRPLRKLAEESVLRGKAERRTGVYTSVHEDSSTALTKQDVSSVEFPKRSIHVLGVGSPFGNDRLGWHVVKQLQERNLIPFERVALTTCDRPGTRLLDLIINVDTVFIIDAMKTGAPDGTVQRFQNEEIGRLPKNLSTHSIGVIEALEIGKALDQLPRQVILYGIEIRGISFEFKISRGMKQAILKLVKRLEQELRDLLNESPSD